MRVRALATLAAVAFMAACAPARADDVEVLPLELSGAAYRVDQGVVLRGASLRIAGLGVILMD